MELSIAYELYMKPDKVPSRKALEICQGAGFRNVDMSIGPFWRFDNTPMLRPGWECWAEELRGTGEELGIRMRQGHSWIQNPCVEDEYATKVNFHLMEVARRLGIEWMVFHTGTLPGAVSRKEHLDANAEWFKRLIDVSRRTGVKVAIENIFDWVDDHVIHAYGVYPDELLEIIQRVGDPDMGVCWDTGHAHLSRMNQYSAIRMLGGKLVATHVHDNRGRMCYDLHVPPFYGSIDWPSVMRGLRDIGYAGTLNFECERHTIPNAMLPEEFRHLYATGLYLCRMMESGNEREAGET